MNPTTAPVTLARARRLAPPGTVPSPCVGVCRMVPTTGLCEGCWRNIDEIVAWGRADDTERLRVWALVEARQAEASTST